MLVEATIVGLIASLAGVAAGIGVAGLLKMLLSAFGIDIPAGALVVTSSTVLTCLAVGTIVTVASALVPARRAGRVPPVAAMRAVAIDRAAGSRRRLVVGSAVLGAGVGSLLAGLSGGTIAARRCRCCGDLRGRRHPGSRPGSPGGQGHRCADGPPGWRQRNAGPRERHAQRRSGPPRRPPH